MVHRLLLCSLALSLACASAKDPALDASGHEGHDHQHGGEDTPPSQEAYDGTPLAALAEVMTGTPWAGPSGSIALGTRVSRLADALLPLHIRALADGSVLLSESGVNPAITGRLRLRRPDGSLVTLLDEVPVARMDSHGGPDAGLSDNLGPMGVTPWSTSGEVLFALFIGDEHGVPPAGGNPPSPGTGTNFYRVSLPAAGSTPAPILDVASLPRWTSSWDFSYDVAWHPAGILAITHPGTNAVGFLRERADTSVQEDRVDVPATPIVPVGAFDTVQPVPTGIVVAGPEALVACYGGLPNEGRDGLGMGFSQKVGTVHRVSATTATAFATGLDRLLDVVLTPKGHLLVATEPGAILEIAPDGTSTELQAGLAFPTSMDISGDTLWVATKGGTLFSMTFTESD